MADPTPVNGQVTDSVTQVQTQVLGAAPVFAMSTLYQSMSQSVGLSMQNAVAQQQQMNAIANAVTAQCVALLAGTPPAAESRAFQAAAGGQGSADLARDLTEVIAALRSLAAGR